MIGLRAWEPPPQERANKQTDNWGLHFDRRHDDADDNDDGGDDDDDADDNDDDDDDTDDVDKHEKKSKVWWQSDLVDEQSSNSGQKQLQRQCLQQLHLEDDDNII